MTNSKKGRFYKGVRVNSFGLPILGKTREIKGEKRIPIHYNLSFTSPFQKDSPKNLIVMYDIPHDQKKERDWSQSLLAPQISTKILVTYLGTTRKILELL